MIVLNAADIIRYWRKVDRRDDDECWPWVSAFNAKGYGVMGLGGRKGRPHIASRISYVIDNGSFDWSLCVCHRCDNPACVNPKHLFLGTRGDNLRDMWGKGRGRTGRNYGAKNGAAKIDEALAYLICDATGTVRDIAWRFGIGKSQVSNIRREVLGDVNSNLRS